MTAAFNQRRFPWLVYWLVFAGLMLFTLSPLLSMLTSTAIADANGCVLDEGSAHPCVVLGSDIGETLSVMFVIAWLMFLTLPLGGGALLVWLIILIIHRIAWQRRTAPVLKGPQA